MIQNRQHKQIKRRRSDREAVGFATSHSPNALPHVLLACSKETSIQKGKANYSVAVALFSLSVGVEGFEG